jgi:glycosyltransferase involved in cell wall biosynthesis
VRICINLFPLSPGRASGGEEVFCRWIVDIPQRVETPHEFTVLLHSSQGRQFARVERGKMFDPFAMLPPPPVAVPGVSPSKPSLLKRAYLHPLVPEAIREGLRFLKSRISNTRRSWLETQGFDVIHCPYAFIDPIPPAHAHIPYCTNLHDLQHEHFPEFFTRNELENRRRHWTRSAKIAKVIFVVADHVKADIVHYCGISPEKIHVVWPGPPFEGLPPISEEQRSSVRRKYALPGRFILYPAVTWEHKNHIRLLEAAEQLRRRRGYRIPLVFSGTMGPYHQVVLAKAASLGLEKQVHWLGYIPYADVRCLYTMADAAVVPTLYEASSGPVLEAMSMGCPVACSTVANLPWVVEDGRAGILFDPLEIEAIEDALQRLWEDSNLRTRLSAAGLERVHQFSWRSFAEGYLRGYEQAAMAGKS